MRRTIVIGLITIFLVVLSAGVAAAKEPATPELTMQEAVNRALELSKTLKIEKTEKEKASEQRSDAQDEVNYTPTGMVNPEIETAYASLLQAELNYQTKLKSYSSLQDDIKEQVVKKYCSVLSADEALDKAQKAFAQAEWERRISQIKLQTGILSPVDMTSVNATCEKAQGDLVEAQQNLNKAYVELNTLVGFGPEERPQLVTDVEYTPLDVVSLTTEVNRAINENTDLWAALQKVTIERQDLRMTKQPYDIEKMEIELAQLNADQAKEQLEEQLLQLYHDIMSMESGIKAAKESVIAAEEGLRVAQVKFDIGMATKGNLIETEAQLATAKSTLANLKYNHAMAMATYRNLTGRDVLPAVLAESEAEEENIT